MHQPSPKRSAFSLVELSIVLVILGLLAGGVLSGQSLIRAAELRSVSTEFSKYFTAVQTFRDKYFAFPGDMSNATKFWGLNPHCSGGTVAADTGTCDGGGDGYIGGITGLAAGKSGEAFEFWHHMALAGLIEGKYTGVSVGAETLKGYLGVNVPKSRLANAGWGARILQDNPVVTQEYYSGDTVVYAGHYGNIFTFGAASTLDDLPNEPILTPEEAWNIDTKLDDGKPGTGGIKARYWNNACATATSNTDYAAPYNLSATGKQCAFYFPTAY